MISKNYIEKLIINFLIEHSEDVIESGTAQEIMESCLSNDWWSVSFVDYADQLNWKSIEKSVNIHFDRIKNPVKDTNYLIKFNDNGSLSGFYKKELVVDYHIGNCRFNHRKFHSDLNEFKSHNKIYERMFDLIDEEKAGKIELPYEEKW